jgi:hypothetical protein
MAKQQKHHHQQQLPMLMICRYHATLAPVLYCNAEQHYHSRNKPEEHTLHTPLLGSCNSCTAGSHEIRAHCHYCIGLKIGGRDLLSRRFRGATPRTTLSSNAQRSVNNTASLLLQAARRLNCLVGSKASCRVSCHLCLSSSHLTVYITELGCLTRAIG